MKRSKIARTGRALAILAAAALMQTAAGPAAAGDGVLGKLRNGLDGFYFSLGGTQLFNASRETAPFNTTVNRANPDFPVWFGFNEPGGDGLDFRSDGGQVYGFGAPVLTTYAEIPAIMNLCGAPRTPPRTTGPQPCQRLDDPTPRANGLPNAEQTIHGSQTQEQSTAHLEPESGFGGHAAIGYGHEFADWDLWGVLRHGIELRGEFEMAYHQMHVRRFYFSGQLAELYPSPDAYNAKINVLNLALNGYTSFGLTKLIRPYIGGGVGWARQKITSDAQGRPNPFPNAGPLDAWRGGATSNGYAIATQENQLIENAFAPNATKRERSDLSLQGMVGIGLMVSDNLELRTGYRFLRIGFKKAHKLTSHHAEIGLIYHF